MSTSPVAFIPAGISHTTHSPIAINGDADLLAQAAAELWPGDGSASDPILIRDLEIDGSSTGSGIAVFNTRLHFSIDACIVFSASSAGIYLQNVTNASVQGNVVNTCGLAIGLQQVSNATVTGNQCSYSTDGIFLSSVSNLTVANNTCDQDSEGIYANAADHVEIINCTLAYNLHGLYLDACQNLTVSRCNSSYNNAGLHADGCYWLLVDNSTFSGSGSEGLWFESCTMFMVADSSSVLSASDGIYIYDGNSFMLTRNNFSDNSDGVVLSYGRWFGFENNTMIGNSQQGLAMDHCIGYGCRNNSIRDSNIGIYVSFSNSTIEQNVVSNCNYGIYAVSSDGIGLRLDNCSHNSVGIYLQSSRMADVYQNNCSWCFTNGILLDSVTESRINDNICSNSSSTLTVRYSNNNEIQWNRCSDNAGPGIELVSSNENMVLRSACDRNDGSGIILSSSYGNTIWDSMCSNNSVAGIEATSGSDRTMIDNNWVSGNVKGILVGYSRDAVVTNNYAGSNVQGGIALEGSLNVTLGWNALEHNGVWLDGVASENWGSHRINGTNTVNGLPVLYLVNQTGVVVTGDVGQVLLATCDGILVDGRTLRDATVGLESGFSIRVLLNDSDCSSNFYGTYSYQTNEFGVSNSSFDSCTEGVFGSFEAFVMVDNSTFSNCPFGVVFQIVNNGIIKDNVIDHFEVSAIDLTSVSGMQVWRNRCDLGGTGVRATSSSLMEFSNNTLTRNSYGISLSSSDSALILDNTCTDNEVGIGLLYATNCVLDRNTMVHDGILISGGFLENWNSHSISTSNTANGRPIYYLKGASGVTVPSDGGQVIVANSDHVTVSLANLTRATVGVSIGFSSYVAVTDVNCSDGYMGLSLVASNHCTVGSSNFSNEKGRGVSMDQDSNCIISSNWIAGNMIGLYAYTSTQNLITMNLFYANDYQAIWLGGISTGNTVTNNTIAFNNGAGTTYDSSHIQAYDEWSGNSWYAPGPVHGWGNYWSDWTTPDTNFDGVVDVPYVIAGTAGSSDLYPLVNPTTPLPIPEFGIVLVLPLAMLLAVLARRRSL